MKLKVKEVINATPDSVVLKFEKPSEDFNYLSGQYITLILTIDGEEVRRAYSLCSSPVVDELPAIGVKRVKGGKVSNYVNDQVKVGDELEILEPMGNFKYEVSPNDQRSFVLMGGGSGMTPLISIAKSVLASESASVVSLINVNLSREYNLFADKIDELKSQYGERFRLIDHYVEEEVLTKKGLFKKVMAPKGIPSVSDLKKYLKSLHIENTDENLCYLCGPSGLMDSSGESLKAIGIDSSRIFRESFVADTSKANKEATSFDGTSEVTIKIMGEEHVIEVTDKPILETALTAGIELPYSCQSGLCTACMCKVTDGNAEMEFADGLTPEQQEEGYLLTCVGHPKSEKVTIEFE